MRSKKVLQILKIKCFEFSAWHKELRFREKLTKLVCQKILDCGREWHHQDSSSAGSSAKKCSTTTLKAIIRLEDWLENAAEDRQKLAKIPDCHDKYTAQSLFLIRFSCWYSKSQTKAIGSTKKCKSNFDGL